MSRKKLMLIALIVLLGSISGVWLTLQIIQAVR